MLAQAFLYNSIFFSYGADSRASFTACRAEHVGLYIVPFAIGNFLGPLLLGPLFDRWGRRVMIPLTYALSGVLLLATGGLFAAGLAERADPDPGVDAGVLRRLRGGELRVPDGERAVPDRDSRRWRSPCSTRSARWSAPARRRCSARSSIPAIPASCWPATRSARTLMLAAAVVAGLLGVDAERRSLEAIAAMEVAP